MHCTILAVGQKMPNWCLLACEEYAKRLQRFMKCKLIEIPTPVRSKSTDASVCKEEEGRKILQKISSQDYLIALDIKGQSWGSETLAKELAQRQLQGRDLVFVIGGPDGLAAACLNRANALWSLSALTFPHALARILLFEQLYRGATILANHPYHRE